MARQTVFAEGLDANHFVAMCGTGDKSRAHAEFQAFQATCFKTGLPKPVKAVNAHIVRMILIKGTDIGRLRE